ncbi:cellulose-growth-specific protein [Tothia fuscella]|uniref:lytic cellulose monooxygenase (C4-dehydrogenating) n=1 Tax=Tothia fuscella TaxID=1048955 RepID=A0A9P4NJJ5_9PEZI|nr:cellulose-growth-specific protein [Tothia fuscella]
MKLSLSALLGASALASAHCKNFLTSPPTDTFPNLIIDNQKMGYYQYTRMTKGHNSHAGVTDVNQKDMRCGGEEPFPTNATVAPVTAGSTVGFTADGTVGHPGPLQFYMAKVPEGVAVQSFDGSGRSGSRSLETSPMLIPKLGAQTVQTTIPKSLPDGNYLLRNGAQIYIQCVQLKVTGGGNGTPSPKVAFPGAYSKADPGIKFQLYWPTPTGYINPGPPVWTG